MHRAFGQLPWVSFLRDGAGLSDGQLLESFLEQQHESAFQALVRRHGPMVLGVCQRILGNVEDAEDAFQATFLVLARKAASVKPRELLGNWLYGVAYRTALKARAINSKRFRKERFAAQMTRLYQPDDDETWNELIPHLDRELNLLPDKLRVPVVLCDIEGKSRKDVARRLGIPEGTLSSRLATARKRLASRLRRYDVALSGGALAVLLTGHAANASVPLPLVSATTKAAFLVALGQTAAVGAVSAAVTTLTEGVLKTMFLAKLKTTMVVMVGVTALSLSTGGLVYQQTRAGAADSGSGQTTLGKVSSDAPQQARFGAKSDLVTAQENEKKELERARREVERAREQAEAARQEAEKQKERAEDELKRARAILEQLAQDVATSQRQDQSNGKRQDQSNGKPQDSKRFSSSSGQSQSRSSKVKDKDKDLNRDKKTLDKLDDAQARVRTQFDRARQSLQKQLKQLDEQEKKALDKLAAEKADLQKRQQPNETKPPSSSGDKLDQILQRLEKLEKRIDKMERRGRDEN